MFARQKRVHLLVLATFVAFSFNIAVLQAQQRTEERSNFGLIFSLEGLDSFRLDEFEGGIGARYYFTDKFAVRTVLDLNVNTTSIERENGSTDEFESDAFRIGFRPGVEYHFKKRGVVSPYLGAEFRLERFSSESTSQSLADAPLRIQESDGTIVGSSVLLGIEVYPVDFLSLAGEYGLSWLSESVDIELREDEQVIRNEDRETTRFNTTTLGSIALTFYF